ncbi:MAG TPA: hypothetical protein VL133_12695 [Devosia sp.]|nr:hypothetical protein [Devosia sp.]
MKIPFGGHLGAFGRHIAAKGLNGGKLNKLNQGLVGREGQPAATLTKDGRCPAC